MMKNLKATLCIRVYSEMLGSHNTAVAELQTAKQIYLKTNNSLPHFHSHSCCKSRLVYLCCHLLELALR